MEALLQTVQANHSKSVQRIKEKEKVWSRCEDWKTWAPKINLKQAMQEATQEGYVGFRWFPLNPNDFKEQLPTLKKLVADQLPGDIVVGFWNYWVCIYLGEESVKRYNLILQGPHGPILDFGYTPVKVKQYFVETE